MGENIVVGPSLPPAQAYGIIDPDYARIFSIARCIGWANGYAIMMHGSFTRDLDLVAVPWTASPSSAEHLVRHLLSTLRHLNIVPHSADDWQPGTKKPHGRLVWTLAFKAFGDPRFVDLSVMPRGGEAASP